MIPKKKFGQNFLIGSQIIDQIIHSLHPNPKDFFLEIGPGLAALTRPLLPLVGKLSIIEIDNDLIGRLNELAKNHPHLTVYHQDALKFNFNELIKADNLKWRVCGNLPYYISSLLLLHCFKYIKEIQDMHFMLQEEVVDRLVSKPNHKSYGRLSIISQYYCEIEKLFVVTPDHFSPAPKVQSAFVRLIPKKNLISLKLENLELVTLHAFNQRRKTLGNSLKRLFTAAQLLELGIDPSWRAENLSLEQFCLLAQNLKNDHLGSIHSEE